MGACKEGRIQSDCSKGINLGSPNSNRCVGILTPIPLEFPFMFLEQSHGEAELPIIGLFSFQVMGFASQGNGEKSHFMGF